MRITSLSAHEILDSKADPTVEVFMLLSDGSFATASVPSGASTGTAEALELRDGDPAWYAGRGVRTAIANIHGPISHDLLSRDFSGQSELDSVLIALDGTPNKSRLGANAILPVSLAFARAVAVSSRLPLYRHLAAVSATPAPRLPRPLVLMLEGGKHGAWATDIQEFMLLPQSSAFPGFSQALEASVRVFRALGSLLASKNYSTGVGFEGAFCPRELSSNDEAFDLIIQAVHDAGFSLPDHFALAIDVAASEFYSDGRYILKSEADQVYDPAAWLEKIVYWTQKYPIASIEDPLDQNQWSSWTDLLSRIGSTHHLVGDDLIVTNVTRIQTAIDNRAINSALIKPNQIGTLTETLSAISLANQAGFSSIMSHRAGETSDDFLADLAVGTASPLCKFGGPDRGERLTKYNRLLKIESELTP